MKQFAALIQQLELTNKTNAKIEAMVRYFSTAPNKDKLWLIALFTGKRPKRPVKTSLMKEWCLEITGLPEWLFLESYSAVGDLGETLSLLLPPPKQQSDKTLSQVIQDLKVIKNFSDEEKKTYILETWDSFETHQRFLINKLIGGSFRVGVSKKLLVNALSKYSGVESNQLMHSIIGNWTVDDITFEDLIEGKHINYDNSKPYPFCLAYALDKPTHELGDVQNWQIEYKWDGIRGQLIKRDNTVFIWSRGEELVTKQFPELVEAVQNLPDSFVLDGEILAMKDANVLQFNDLQKRLNRKNVSKALMAEVPVNFRIYDILEWNGVDIRSEALINRQTHINKILNFENQTALSQSHELNVRSWDDVKAFREEARSQNSEGLMLKLKQSPYHTGRIKGDWWKWKVDPLCIDAVLIYAQKGSGRRSGFYTDYTFAVRDGDKLVNIAKAYSGLTNEEIKEVSKFVTKNATEKFGPVRTVIPELVFEIAFEGIALSNRHKSGVALRFPRIARWRKDKLVSEIDDIDSVKLLITANS
ncbi:ATP-dependent DNA ligase [Paucihalobacter sp.]|uniref:ATP-dependent DNA ligase n=1 Tax=Paucihalobacter sp. TaxID=2850405 RepID=UPI002FDFA721